MTIFLTIVITFVITFLATVLGISIFNSWLLMESEWYREFWRKLIGHYDIGNFDED